MSTEKIRSSIEETINYLKVNPDKSCIRTSAAVAVLERGLKVRATGFKDEVIISDMSPAEGGEGSAPSPGWFLRAAMATCHATEIAMKAALEGIELSTLEVSVDSEFDERGIFGIDESVKAGPLNMRTRVRVHADGVAKEKLNEIVEWAKAHSWVVDAIHRAIPIKLEIEVV